MSTVQQLLTIELKQLKKDIHTLVEASHSYPEYMNLTEACSYINVSANVLKRYITEYGLSVIKIDGVKRISRSELDRFMLSHAS
jgi:hypothetical protein